MILDKIDFRKSWGKICNEINDVAHQVLTTQEMNVVIDKQNKDAQTCEDLDGVLFNGCYFDWRMFNHNVEIVTAFLKYFTPKQLELIEGELAKEIKL